MSALSGQCTGRSGHELPLSELLATSRARHRRWRSVPVRRKRIHIVHPHSQRIHAAIQKHQRLTARVPSQQIADCAPSPRSDLHRSFAIKSYNYSENNIAVFLPFRPPSVSRFYITRSLSLPDSGSGRIRRRARRSGVFRRAACRGGRICRI